MQSDVGPQGGADRPFLSPSAGHQLILQDHRYKASASRYVSVQVPAFAGIELYCLVTEAGGCEQLAQSRYAVMPCLWILRPLDCKLDALPSCLSKYLISKRVQLSL